jgi:hypothetical protein
MIRHRYDMIMHRSMNYNLAKFFVIGDGVDSFPAFHDFRCVPENKTWPVSAFTPCLSVSRTPSLKEDMVDKRTT